MNKLIYLILSITCFNTFGQKEAKTDNLDETLNQKVLDQKQLDELLKRNKDSKGHIVLIYKYINDKYVEPAIKENKKLEGKIKRAKDLIAKATKASTKENYEKKLKEIEIQFKVNKLWIIYSKAYVKMNDSLKRKDNETYKASMDLISRIRNGYRSLTGESFPHPDIEFYRLYGNKLKKKAQGTN